MSDELPVEERKGLALLAKIELQRVRLLHVMQGETIFVNHFALLSAIQKFGQLLPSSKEKFAACLKMLATELERDAKG